MLSMLQFTDPKYTKVNGEFKTPTPNIDMDLLVLKAWESPLMARTY